MLPLLFVFPTPCRLPKTRWVMQQLDWFNASSFILPSKSRSGVNPIQEPHKPCTWEWYIRFWVFDRLEKVSSFSALWPGISRIANTASSFLNLKNKEIAVRKRMLNICVVYGSCVGDHEISVDSYTSVWFNNAKIKIHQWLVISFQ